VPQNESSAAKEKRMKQLEKMEIMWRFSFILNNNFK